MCIAFALTYANCVTDAHAKCDADANSNSDSDALA